MAKKEKVYWKQAFGPTFQPLREVDWKVFASLSPEEVEMAMAKVLNACGDSRYSYELEVKQHGKYIHAQLTAKRHWWAVEGTIHDWVDCFIMEWIPCPKGKEYKAFKK